MKELKIKQEFLNYIKSGEKDFEIRKDGNLEGIVELVVKREYDKKHPKYEEKLGDYLIWDRLKVELTKTNMTAFDIGCYLMEKKKNNMRGNYSIMLNQTIDFISKDYWNGFDKDYDDDDYFKQGDELYLYKVEIIKE